VTLLALLEGRIPEGGPALRRALTAAADSFVRGAWEVPPGACLVAVGGYGRGELAPGSDLDLVLVHEPTLEVSAEPLWYAIWDAKIGLDQSTRTVSEAVKVASEDPRALLGLLDARHVAGDEELAGRLSSEVRTLWRASAARRLADITAMVQARHARAGELAFLLEPDLKEARGGLRDATLTWAVALAQLVDAPAPGTRGATELLLDVRCALHLHALDQQRRPDDVLRLTDQAAVARRLGLADEDVLAGQVATAGREIALACSVALRRGAALAPVANRRRVRLPGRSLAERRPLAEGVVEQAGEVVLARAVDDVDAALVLRVARACAVSGLPISEFTLKRMAEVDVELPWSSEVREGFLALLGSGAALIGVVEVLDAAGIWERFVPEWPSVRSKPQRNAYHRFTVDRHLLEVVVEASALTRTVARPDLLLLAAFLHDVGKGYPGDHTDVGVQLVPGIAGRMGLPDVDIAILVTLVRHHLTLADTATRRDLDDPATSEALARSVGSHEVLMLLRALTEADSIGTGPSMWSGWKRGLLDDLTRRAAAVLGGEELPDTAALTRAVLPAVRRLQALGGVQVDRVHEDTVVCASPDAPGLLRAIAGVLALHRLDIRGVDGTVQDGLSVVVVNASPRFGTWPDWVLVREDIRRALSGELDALSAVAEREAAYPPAAALALAAPATVVWVDGASSSATVCELRAPDAPALLARALSALAECGVDLRSARCSTLGVEVVDAFYLTEADGSLIDGRTRRAQISERLLAAVS
jgi:[protein-PII] uridylyltransferase